MKELYLISLCYAYSHYGSMAFLYGMGVYKERTKEFLKDLIPFRWAYQVTKETFFKKSSE